MAERAGFEPAVAVIPRRRFSKPFLPCDNILQFSCLQLPLNILCIFEKQPAETNRNENTQILSIFCQLDLGYLGTKTATYLIITSASGAYCILRLQSTPAEVGSNLPNLEASRGVFAH